MSQANPTITILAGDKLRPGRCSRCAGELGMFQHIAVWNGAEFPYCGACANPPAAPHNCPTCGQPLERVA
jgi:hypothetical protein